MSEQVGASIKEARMAAGMTQKDLAGAVDGVSASDVSKAERGLKELSDEQLEGIAQATGVDFEQLANKVDGADVDVDASVVEDASPDAQDGIPAETDETTASASETPVDAEQELRGLIESADDDALKAAVAVLKGETPQQKSILDTILPVVAGIVGNQENGASPLAVILGFLGSDDGKALIQNVMGMLSGMFQSLGSIVGGSQGENGGQGGKVSHAPLLTFTFLYSVTIYVLLLSFYFWQVRTDIKPKG